MGEKPFSIAISRNVNIYFVGKDRITIDEALNKLKNGEFPLAKEIDSELFFKHGKHDHKEHEVHNNK